MSTQSLYTYYVSFLILMTLTVYKGKSAFIYRGVLNINISHDSVILAKWLMILPLHCKIGQPQKMDNGYKEHECI